MDATAREARVRARLDAERARASDLEARLIRAARAGKGAKRTAA